MSEFRQRREQAASGHCGEERALHRAADVDGEVAERGRDVSVSLAG